MIDRILAAAARAAARAVRQVIVAYAEIYHDDDDGEEDSGPLRYDPRSSVSGLAEIAANRDHDTPGVYAFGFTPRGRAGR